MLKTGIYGLLTLLVAAGGLAAATNMNSNRWSGFVIAFGVVAWFIWGLNRRWKKADERRIKERLFSEYMRSKHGYRSFH